MLPPLRFHYIDLQLASVSQRHTISKLLTVALSLGKMAIAVKRIKLGSQGFDVSAQGLGCMSMSWSYGPAKPEADMIKVIHHAINNGVTHFDTSDVYGPHTNEILVGKVL